MPLYLKFDILRSVMKPICSIWKYRCDIRNMSMTWRDKMLDASLSAQVHLRLIVELCYGCFKVGSGIQMKKMKMKRIQKIRHYVECWMKGVLERVVKNPQKCMLHTVHCWSIKLFMKFVGQVFVVESRSLERPAYWGPMLESSKTTTLHNKIFLFFSFF